MMASLTPRGFLGTPIGTKRREEALSAHFSRGRESECSEYSYACDLDLEDLDEDDLVKLRLPELPEDVRDAFRCVARNETKELGKALATNPRLVFARNRGGSTLFEVAVERGRTVLAEMLRTSERAQTGEAATPVASPPPPPVFSEDSPPPPPPPAAPSPEIAREAERLDAWLAREGLEALADAVADVAGDVEDLAEMTDDDVDDMIRAAGLSGDDAGETEARLRRALRGLGAAVAAADDDGDGGDGGGGEARYDDESDAFAERGDFDESPQKNHDCDGDVSVVRVNFRVPLAHVAGVLGQLPTPPTPSVSVTPERTSNVGDASFTDPGTVAGGASTPVMPLLNVAQISFDSADGPSSPARFGGDDDDLAAATPISPRIDAALARLRASAKATDEYGRFSFGGSPAATPASRRAWRSSVAGNDADFSETSRGAASPDAPFGS